MRLLIDAQALQSASALRGIGRYGTCLARALVGTAGEHEVELLLNGGGDPLGLVQTRDAIEAILPSRAIHVLDAAWPWERKVGGRLRPAAESAYGAAVRSLAPDALLVLSAFESDLDTVLAIGRHAEDPPTAALLFDLMPALDPATYLMGPDGAAYRRRLEDFGRCDALLAISEHSAEQARTILGPHGPPITTIWGGPFPTAAESDDDVAIPGRFVLTVGGDHPRKNLDRLVQAWGMVSPALRADVALVVACGLHEGTVRRLTALGGRFGLTPEDLVLAGRVSDPALARLYTNAEAFVFPSLDEGLGMPPLEAMAAGCPTLLARGSSLSELSDEPSSYFDPTDAVDIARALAAVLSDHAQSDRLRSAAARSAAAFTWERSAQLAWGGLMTLTPSTPRPPGAHAAAKVVQLSDDEGIRRLPWSPAPVLIDAALPCGPSGILGLPVPPRAALAAATMLLVPSVDAARSAVHAGIIDVPLLLPGTAPRHDFLAEHRRSLAPLHLGPDVAGEVLRAAVLPPRWTLERPRMTWLMLKTGHGHMPIADDDPDVHVAEGLESAAGLAVLVDVVLVPAERVGVLYVQLLRARGRGASVVALHPEGAPPCLQSIPAWCHVIPIDGAFGIRDVRRALEARGHAVVRSTGWPWRQGA